MFVLEIEEKRKEKCWTHLPVSNNDNSPLLTHESRSAGSCWWLCPHRPLGDSAPVETPAPSGVVDRNVAIHSWDDCVIVHP